MWQRDVRTVSFEIVQLWYKIDPKLWKNFFFSAWIVYVCFSTVLLFQPKQFSQLWSEVFWSLQLLRVCFLLKIQKCSAGPLYGHKGFVFSSFSCCCPWTCVCRLQIKTRLLKTRKMFKFILSGGKKKKKEISDSSERWTMGTRKCMNNLRVEPEVPALLILLQILPDSQSKISSLFTSQVTMLPPAPSAAPCRHAWPWCLKSPTWGRSRVFDSGQVCNSASFSPPKNVWWVCLHLYAPCAGTEECASPLTSLLLSCDLPHIHYWSQLSVAWLPIDGRRLDCEVSWMYNWARNKRLWQQRGNPRAVAKRRHRRAVSLPP